MQVLIKGMQPLAKKKDKNYYDVLSRALKLTSQAADKFTFPYRVQIQKNKMSLVCDNCRRASLRFQGHNFCCFVLVLNAKTYLLAFPAYWKQMLALLPWCVGAAGSSTWFSVRLYLPLLSEGVKGTASGWQNWAQCLPCSSHWPLGLSPLLKWSPLVTSPLFLKRRTS